MTNEELTARIQQGEQELMPQLWEQTRDLIAMLSGRWHRSHADLCRRAGVTEEDLIQGSYFALCAAVEGFVPEKGKLATLLAWHLKAGFLRTVGGSRRIHDPLSVSVSLDAPTAGEDGEITLGDALPADYDPLQETEERILQEQLRATLEELLGCMPTIEAEIIRARYFRGETLSAIAEARNQSLSRVAQLQQRALRTLRKPQYARRLQPFLMPETYAWTGTGLQSFQRRQASSVERAVEIAEHKRKEAEEKSPRKISKAESEDK